MTRLALGASGLALSLACLGIPTAAGAAENSITVEANRPVAHVQISDINLLDPAGLNVLNARVRVAARRLCTTGSIELPTLMAERACFKEAMTSAAPQVDRAVTEYAKNGTGGSRAIQVALRR